jgi:hypothetical protein
MYSCFLGWGWESSFFKSGLMGVANTGSAKIAQNKIAGTKVRHKSRTYSEMHRGA